MHLQVNCSASQRGELRDLVQIFRCSVIDVSAHTMTLEVQGREDKMRAIVELMEPYGGLAATSSACLQLYCHLMYWIVWPTCRPMAKCRCEGVHACGVVPRVRSAHLPCNICLKHHMHLPCQVCWRLHGRAA